MHKIALVNQKGGVGKSTTAVSLSAGLAQLGRRVLLIDLDPQSHATVALGLDPRRLDATVYSLLAGQATLPEVIRPVSDGLSLIPASIDLAGGEAELVSQADAQYFLRNALREIDESQFDFAIIDAPPQLGFLNVNGLAWVRHVLIPTQCEFYALHGLSLLMQTVESVRERFNPDLRISAVIPCQVHPRRKVTREVLAEIERHLPGMLTRTHIRVNVRLVEAPSHGVPIQIYAPDSNGAVDYMNLAKEILERLELLEGGQTAGASGEETAEPVAGEAGHETVVVMLDEPEKTGDPFADFPPRWEDIEAAKEPVEVVSGAVEPTVLEAEPLVESSEQASEPQEAAEEREVSPDVGTGGGNPGSGPCDGDAPAESEKEVSPAPDASSKEEDVGLGTAPFAKAFAMAGLRPIVDASRPVLPPRDRRKGLFGRLLGRKE